MANFSQWEVPYLWSHQKPAGMSFQPIRQPSSDNSCPYLNSPYFHHLSTGVGRRHHCPLFNKNRVGLHNRFSPPHILILIVPKGKYFYTYKKFPHLSLFLSLFHLLYILLCILWKQNKMCHSLRHFRTQRLLAGASADFPEFHSCLLWIFFLYHGTKASLTTNPIIMADPKVMMNTP